MLLSLVIPVYNEEKSLPLLMPILQPVLDGIDCAWEVLLVNDGSQDGTPESLEAMAAADNRIKVLHFSRNFGHQAAVTAGLDRASGDAVIVMDCDLQDPPELLPALVQFYREGYDIVSPQRAKRAEDSWFKRTTASMFYSVMRSMVDKRLPPEVGDFRLFSRRAVEAMRGFREQHRFLRGLAAWLGLKEVFVPFERQKRSAGETHYPLHKMIALAWTAILSFSPAPLRTSFFVGWMLCLAGLAYVAYVIYANLFTSSTVPGWTSVVGLQVISSGAILIALGLIGEYVARIFEESKNRPLYVVSETRNLETPVPSVDRGLTLPPKTHLQKKG